MAKEKGKIPEGLATRIGISAFGGIFLLIAALAYLAFLPSTLTLFQNIAIVGIILLAFAAVMIVVWVPWGINNAESLAAWGERMEKYDKKGSWDKCSCNYKSPKETAVSSLTGIAFMIIIIGYIAFYAEGYTLFQSIAIIAIAALLVGAVNAMIWIPRQLKFAEEASKPAKKRK